MQAFGDKIEHLQAANITAHNKLTSGTVSDMTVCHVFLFARHRKLVFKVV